jgi:hypothetical protein
MQYTFLRSKLGPHEPAKHPNFEEEGMASANGWIRLNLGCCLEEAGDSQIGNIAAAAPAGFRSSPGCASKGESPSHAG